MAKRNELDKQTAEEQQNWEIRRDRRAKITTCFVCNVTQAAPDSAPAFSWQIRLMTE